MVGVDARGRAACELPEVDGTHARGGVGHRKSDISGLDSFAVINQCERSDVGESSIGDGGVRGVCVQSESLDGQYGVGGSGASGCDLEVIGSSWDLEVCNADLELELADRREWGPVRASAITPARVTMSEQLQVQEQGMRWSRLFRQGRPVGFMRSFSKHEYYSVDGYGWSGEPISHDRCVPELGVRGQRGQRIYVGDVIRYTAADSQETALMVALRSASGSLWLGGMDAPELLPLSLGASGERDGRLGAVVGSIHQDPDLRLRFERSVALLEAPARSPEWLGGTTGLSISLGILASGGLQWVWTGGVGPILSVLGGVAGCLLWFQLLGRHQTGWMTRPAVLDSTRFSGAVTGAVLAVTYAVLSIFGGAGIASVEPHLPVGFGALAVLGFLIGAGIPIFTSSSLGYEAVDDDA